MSNPRQHRDENDDHQLDDETEYHFVEDEFTYQVENDMKAGEKKAPSAPSSFQKQLQQLKQQFTEMQINRIAMMGGAFLVFVVVVYKMMSPSSSDNKAVTFETAPQHRVASAPIKPAIVHPQQVQSVVSEPMPVAQTGGMDMSSAPLSAAGAGEQMKLSPVMPLKGEATPVPSGVVPASQVDSKLSQVNQSNQAIINQMQAEYTQKLNEYATQNKALQEDVKTLTGRVSTLESELNQLLQALMKTNIASQVGASPASETQNVDTGSSEVQDVRLPYTVQAIIPGRAWLRGETGETVTVGEGDALKEGGRVSKIDPYDGVVEVTMGNKKVVTLSYGNTEQQ